MQVGSRGMKRSEHGNSAGGQAINENTNWVGKRQKTKKNIKRVINKIFHKKGRKKNEIHKQVWQKCANGSKKYFTNRVGKLKKYTNRRVGVIDKHRQVRWNREKHKRCQEIEKITNSDGAEGKIQTGQKKQIKLENSQRELWWTINGVVTDNRVEHVERVQNGRKQITSI